MPKHRDPFQHPDLPAFDSPALAHIHPDLRPLAKPVKEVVKDAQNVRLHDERSLTEIRASLVQFTQRKNVVVQTRPDGSKIVRAGNGTLDAVLALGKEWIAAIYEEEPDAHARAFALADNRTAELSRWDLPALKVQLDEQAELLVAVPGFDKAFLTGLTNDLQELRGQDEPSGPADPGASEPPAQPKSQLGEVYALGPHLLVCGDSSDPALVATLLADGQPGLSWFDPPYGMGLDTTFRNMHSGPRAPGAVFSKWTAADKITGDSEPFEPAAWLELWRAPETFWWGADYYRRDIPMGGSWVVWDKRANEQGMNLDAVHGSHFELCWSSVQHKREIARVTWSGHHGLQGEDTGKRVHPTQKPVELCAWVLSRWAPKGCVVGDPFAGSGSMLIACARTGRIWRGVELSPAYCDVIRKRWTEFARTASVDPGTGAL